MINKVETVEEKSSIFLSPQIKNKRHLVAHTAQSSDHHQYPLSFVRFGVNVLEKVDLSWKGHIAFDAGKYLSTVEWRAFHMFLEFLFAVSDFRTLATRV